MKWTLKNKKTMNNEEQEKPKKEKRKVVTRWKFRKTILICGWMLLAGSVSFGVYKNFTAIDTHTIYQKEKVVEKVKDISGMETFVTNFATDYFTLSTDNDFKNDRVKQLEKYMQKDLIAVNSTMLSELKEPVTVQKVEIWKVEPLDADGKNCTVWFTVQQKVKDNLTKSAYTVDVYSTGSAFVITKNPTVASLPKKSSYTKKYLTSDDTIEAKTRTNITTFLTTFFGLYPKASEKELVYYVKDITIQPLNKDYKFVSLDNLVIKKKDSGYKIACFVTFKDNTTQALLTSQYELLIDTQEDGELIINEMR